jgi:hypothetical protein
MARFIVIEDSSAAGQIREIATCAAQGLVTAILRREGSRGSFVTTGEELKSKVIREFTYTDDSLQQVLFEAIRWAEETVEELWWVAKTYTRGGDLRRTTVRRLAHKLVDWRTDWRTASRGYCCRSSESPKPPAIGQEKRPSEEGRFWSTTGRRELRSTQADPLSGMNPAG